MQHNATQLNTNKTQHNTTHYKYENNKDKKKKNDMIWYNMIHVIQSRGMDNGWIFIQGAMLNDIFIPPTNLWEKSAYDMSLCNS